jgi:hypothetical protein
MLGDGFALIPRLAQHRLAREDHIAQQARAGNALQFAPGINGATWQAKVSCQILTADQMVMIAEGRMNKTNVATK